jgi:hypothetical protein
MLQGSLWKVGSYAAGQEMSDFNRKLSSMTVFAEVRH